MKRLLPALLCAVLTSVVGAEDNVTVVKVSAGAPASAAACGQQGGPLCHGKHATVGEELKTICLPQPSVKVKVTIKYFSEDAKVCYPKCGPTGCASCALGQCNSTIYPKRYLIKKIETKEEPITKCVPVTVRACDVPNLLHTQLPPEVKTPGPTTPPVETVPVPPVKR